MDPAPAQYGNPPPRSGWTPDPTGRGGPVRRTRIGAVVLAAVLTELVLIGVGANQWASERIVRNLADNGVSAGLYAGSWLTYSWRWNPSDGRIWWSEILLIATLAVVSGLLVWSVVRGPVSFGRAFLGTWMAVIVATLLGAFVRGLVEPDNGFVLPRSDAVTRAIFGPAGPNSETVVGSVVLGLVVALVAALVATSTARTEGAGPESWEPAGFADYGPPAAAAAGAAPPPWQDQHYGPPARPMTPPPMTPPLTTPPPARPWTENEAQTTQLPAPDRDADGQPTTQLPTADAPPPPVGAPEQATSRFPRPPDDEDLGHVER